jgi:NitT/TauT family transport system substrate-binding protein
VKITKKGLFQSFSTLVLVSMLASCAAASPTSSEVTNGKCGPVGASTSLEPIQIANGGTTEAPAVEWGKQQGCFEKNGLEVSNSVIEDAEAVAALQSGSVQVISLSLLNLVLYASNGNLDLKIISPSAGYSQEELDRGRQEPLYPGELLLQSTILVPADSDIKTFADLEGKVVGGTATGQSALAVMSAITANGGDSSKVEILDIPAPARQSTLERGEVDAIVMTGRFASEGIESGLRLLGYPGAYFYDEGPLHVWLTSGSVFETQPELIQKFRDSILLTNQELRDTEANAATYRQILVDVFGLTSQEADETLIPNYLVDEVTLVQLQIMAEKLSKLKSINSVPDLSLLLLPN